MKKYLIVILIFSLGILLGGFGGVKLEQLSHPPAELAFPSGQDVLDELQEYRVSEGLEKFELSQPLCNNIVARWQKYIDTNSHEGFEEWAEHYYPNKDVAEIIVTGDTAEEMVEFWKSSPSHNLYIHNYSKICVYSLRGKSVAILSN